MTFRAGVILIWVAAILGCSREPAHCWVCQREIHPQVAATLTLGNGKKVPACCPRCALHYQEEPGNRVRRITVSDYAGNGTLPLSEAFLVEGSDETPCVHHPAVMDESKSPMQVCFDRCMPSLIAFRTRETAQRFQSDHGGTLYPPGDFPGLPPPTP
jgi:hypothetical protein